MSKVQVTADGLRALYSHAKSAGTIGAWAEVALEWADKAESELARLKAIVDKLPLALMASYLDDYADHLSNQVCDEAELPGTPENRAFWSRVCEAEEFDVGDWMPEAPGKPILVMSTLIARYLAREAAEAAKENTPR